MILGGKDPQLLARISERMKRGGCTRVPGATRTQWCEGGKEEEGEGEGESE